MWLNFRLTEGAARGVGAGVGLKTDFQIPFLLLAFTDGGNKSLLSMFLCMFGLVVSLYSRSLLSPDHSHGIRYHLISKWQWLPPSLFLSCNYLPPFLPLSAPPPPSLPSLSLFLSPLVIVFLLLLVYRLSLLFIYSMPPVPSLFLFLFACHASLNSFVYVFHVLSCIYWSIFSFSLFLLFTFMK